MMGSQIANAKFIREENVTTLLCPSKEKKARKEGSFTCWAGQLPNLQYSQATKTGQRWSIWFNRNCIGKNLRQHCILHMSTMSSIWKSETLNPPVSYFRAPFCSVMSFHRVRLSPETLHWVIRGAFVKQHDFVRSPASRNLQISL